jgi:hypothetical protein
MVKLILFIPFVDQKLNHFHLMRVVLHAGEQELHDGAGRGGDRDDGVPAPSPC